MAQQDDLASGRALMQQLGRALTSFGKKGGSGVTKTRPERFDAILDALQALAKKNVLVGIPAENADRDDGDTFNNAERLYIHEYGAADANIPARPTVMPGIQNARDPIAAFFAAAARAAVRGDARQVEQYMHSAGLAAADAIKAMINSNVQPPLSERTLREREERGVTRTNTLIDFAEMRNAVTYVLRDKNETPSG